MDRLRVVAIESERDRLERGRGAGDGHERARITDRERPPPLRPARRRSATRGGRAPPAPADRSRRTARSAGRSPSASRSRVRRGPAHARRRTRWNHRRCRAPGTAAVPIDGSSPWVPPRNDSPASRSPLITSSSLPASSRTAATNSSRFAASRTALVAATRMRSDVQRACSAREASEHVDGAAERLGIERARPIDALTEARDDHVAGELGRFAAGRRRRLHHEQPDRVGSLVDRGHATRPLVGVDGLRRAPRPTGRPGRAARQMERVVRVQALHPAACAADPSVLDRRRGGRAPGPRRTNDARRATPRRSRGRLARAR